MTGGSFTDDHQPYKSILAGPGFSINGVFEAPIEQPLGSLPDLSLSCDIWARSQARDLVLARLANPG